MIVIHSIDIETRIHRGIGSPAQPHIISTRAICEVYLADGTVMSANLPLTPEEYELLSVLMQRITKRLEKKLTQVRPILDT